MQKFKKVGATAEAEAVAREVEELEFAPVDWDKPITFEHGVLSTGSTLLDLAISGNRIHGGGVPPGIMVEVSGQESTGKSAVLAEICSHTQSRKPKGDVVYADPEGRFDAEYRRIYKVELPRDKYYRPDTVTGLFDIYDKWQPKGKGISVFATDSLAALSTEKEMEDGDKMGMRRAKEFSEALRKYARRIAEDNRLFICSNQMREGQWGKVTPGGYAVRFYSSLRIQLFRAKGWRVVRTRKAPSGKEIQRQVAIITEAEVIKSSIDAPFRTAPVYIEFGYGIDDVRANLQWLKDMTKNTAFGIDKQTSSQRMDVAIQRVEDNDREGDLREEVITTWHELDELFAIDRKPKTRG